jgi:hypothetical protein
MKVKIAATIFFLLGTILFLINVLASKQKYTKVLADFDIINLGEIEKNSKEMAVGSFYLKNCGKNNLNIYQLERDCICTDYSVSDPIVFPNDSVKVLVIYDKRNPGYFSHYIKVHCNSENSPYIFTIIGTIVDNTD